VVCFSVVKGGAERAVAKGHPGSTKSVFMANGDCRQRPDDGNGQKEDRLKKGRERSKVRRKREMSIPTGGAREGWQGRKRERNETR